MENISAVALSKKVVPIAIKIACSKASITELTTAISDAMGHASLSKESTDQGTAKANGLELPSKGYW